MAADGSNPRRLTESPAADTNPSWSPAGDAIVFTTASPTGAPQLATVGPEGGAVRILTSGDQAEWQSVDDVAVTVRATRSVRRGRPLRLRVLIRNKTEMPAYNVLLRTSFPAGFRVLRARSGSTQSCGRSGARSVTCWLPRLGGSATAAAEIVLRPQRCGRASLQESVVGGQADFEPADNRRRLALRVTCPRPTQRRTNR
jgi:hypothetical protein